MPKLPEVSAVVLLIAELGSGAVAPPRAETQLSTGQFDVDRGIRPVGNDRAREPRCRWALREVEGHAAVRDKVLRQAIGRVHCLHVDRHPVAQAHQAIPVGRDAVVDKGGGIRHFDRFIRRNRQIRSLDSQTGEDNSR